LGKKKTLQQAIVYFDKVENCNAFMMAARWADGRVRCPSCDSDNVIYLETARLWKCRTKHPRQKFSLKVATIFEDSALGLDKWLVAIWLIANAKNGISSCELARSLGVTQKSAWHMLHRMRPAFRNS
jgi:transposase-like protein